MIKTRAPASGEENAIGGEVYMVGTSGETSMATSSSTFWNSNHLSSININQNGITLSAMEEPWTGTNPGGTSSGIALTCQDWTDGINANLASTGDTSTANANG